MSHYITTYLQNISSAGFLTDRVIDDNLTLPYDFNNIKIKPNDIVNSLTYNNVIDKLNDNFLYLISNGSIATNNLPINYTHILSGNGESFNYYPSTAYQSLSSRTQFYLNGGRWSDNLIDAKNVVYGLFSNTDAMIEGLNDGDFFIQEPFDTTQDNIKDISFVGNDTTTAGVVCDSNKFMLLSAAASTSTNSLSAKIISESNTITDSVNRDPFTNIKTTQTDKNNDIYILNEKTIIKYDVSGALTNDASLNVFSNSSGRLKFGNELGGEGNLDKDTQFNDPVSFSIFNDRLYVIDVQGTDSFYIKEFDINFNFKKTHNVSKILNSHTIADILATESKILVLTTTGYIASFSNDFKSSQLHEPDPPTKDDIFRKVETCASDNNVFYVLTKTNIYKKFISKPTKTIGKFKINEAKLNILNPDFSSISSRLLNNLEELFVADNNNAAIYRFLEDIGHQDAFFDTFQTQIFPVSSLRINPNEYLNNFTFNKSFSKLLFNHFVLKENARGKFEGTFDSEGTLLYDGLRYPLDHEIAALEYNTSNDNYIGINEIFLSKTINRPLKRIYDLQLLILDFIKERRTNTFPLSTAAVTLPS